MFSPSRLRIARKRRGWTVTTLARTAGLSTRSVSTYENGRQEPSAPTIEQLARAVEVPSTFLLGDDVDEVPVDAVSFRALSKMPARARDRGLASGRIAMLINDWIEARFDLPAPDLPTLDNRHPEQAAQELRSRWGLGVRPLGNVVHLLEAHGVRVYSATQANTDLDAFCMYHNGRPFVFIGSDKTPERSRFDAAHELGHLIMHRGDQLPHGLDAEKDANRFAAAFLMPASDLLAHNLRNATASHIRASKGRWSVAAMALAHRLNELGLMSEWAYRNACIDLARAGYRRSEPGGMPSHESSQLLTKVLQQLRSSGLGIQQIAADLSLHPAEVRSYMFGLAPTVIEGNGLRTDTPPASLQVVH
ncbi:Zn-dependent peptidase ImmA (M78 family) [Tamaricihabitans halophyticus]|uniref:Zn-dependent peptidase ImmA (M78 family) n=1 Tax=Tamaricihabitans halophyticus TaxID=1262583 RepID=A0A4R2PU35_9PSEU|nr:XRE family transcriptional regulator [Tamaricihabitans halophyticus]TCP39377.1 Zn-dependent peptidase ImmA (M78 family) [Tamaricihabitans halophyticus]